MGHSGKCITFISLLLTFCLAPSVQADVFEVTTNLDPPPNGCDSGVDCSLREAIIAANENDEDGANGNDEIVLQAETYVLTRQGTDNDAQSGDLDITDGNNSTTITGVSAEATIIDATDLQDRILDLQVGSNQVLNVSNLTLQEGDAGAADGGAIRIAGELGGGNTINVSDCRLLNNHATNGGAIWGSFSNFGGGLSRSILSGNTASMSGGAIYNTSGFGFPILDSTIDDNEAEENAGGIFMESQGIVDIRNSTISNNTAGDIGGGLFMTGVGGPIGINNSTFSGNEAGNGGAMRLGSLSNLRLRNITITDNTASGLGGGIYVPPLQSVSTSNIANSILAGNSDNSASPDCFKDTDASLDFTSLGYNVFGTVTGCPIPLNTGDLTGVSDPLLGPLTDNGGPTPTHGNLEDSPAVDAGDPSGCLDSNDVEFTTDQRGEPRPLNGRCDVGAFEGIFVPPSPSPVPTESPGGGGAETESGGCAMGGSTGVDMTGFWGVLFLLSLAWGARRGMR